MSMHHPKLEETHTYTPHPHLGSSEQCMPPWGAQCCHSTPMWPPASYHPLVSANVHHTRRTRRKPSRHPLLPSTAAHATNPTFARVCAGRQSEMLGHHVTRCRVEQLHTARQASSRDMRWPIPARCTAGAVQPAQGEVVRAGYTTPACSKGCGGHIVPMVLRQCCPSVGLAAIG